MKPYQVKLVVAAVMLLLFVIFTTAAFDIVPVKGNQIGVKETWFEGVVNEPLPPATYFILPWQRCIIYPTSVNVFTMNDKDNQGAENGRHRDAYLVQSKDSQDMHISIQVQWRIDPANVITIHKTVGPELIEEKLLRPTLLRCIKNEATVLDALYAYSGEGLVELQQSIEKDLNATDGELRLHGIIVDNFVIENIRLDGEYTAEIKARQVAMQKEKRAVQEIKTAMAEADKAKAVARASFETMSMNAERDKAVKVLEAEALNEQAILAAQAEAQKTILAAEADAKKAVLAAQAEKDSGELKAAGILAVGRAMAESEKLKFSAFSAPGSEVYMKIEVAKSLAQAFGNVKGYLPENMQIFTLGDSFLKAVENVVVSEQKK